MEREKTTKRASTPKADGGEKQTTPSAEVVPPRDFAQLSAAEVLYLQRTVGNDATRRLVQPRVNITPRRGEQTVQRVALDTATMITLLKSIPGLQTFLADDKLNPQRQKLAEHATKMMQNYEREFAAGEATDAMKNAMMLAAGAKTVGHYIAFTVLENPWLAGEISAKLVEYYKPDLVAALQAQHVTAQDAAQSVDLAAVFVSADPIMLYMTNKIDQAEAAKKIYEMAHPVGQPALMTGAAMYDKLYQQYQMELASFTKAEAQTGTIGAVGGRGRGAFGTGENLSGEADLIGELSAGHFESILDLDVGGNTQWNVHQLLFKHDAQVKLTALRAAVQALDAHPPAAAAVLAPNPKLAANPEWARLNASQQQRLLQVEAAEAAQTAGGGIYNQVSLAVQTALNLLPIEAERIINGIITGFFNVPMVISFPTHVVFANPVGGPHLIYQSALKRVLNTKAYSELFPNRGDATQAGGTVETVGGAHDMREHRQNANYNRWRYEKDVKPKGYSDIGIREMPEFANLAPSFRLVEGQDTTDFGENQYGESGGVMCTSHAQLKRDVLTGRGMFQFTAKGPLRRDPLMLLYDIAVTVPDEAVRARQEEQRIGAALNAAVGEVAKVPLRQQLTEARALSDRLTNKYLQATNILTALISNALNASFTSLDQQQIEVQISGELDFGRDLSAFYLNPKASTQIKQNVRTFAATAGITVIDMVAPANVTVIQGNTSAMITDQNKPLIQGILRNSDTSPDADFYKLAQTLMMTQIPVPGPRIPLFDELCRQFAAAYNRMGYWKRHSKEVSSIFEQVNAHIRPPTP